MITKVWGLSDKGILGLGDNVIEAKDLVVIPQLENRGVSKISIGEFHAAASTINHEVFVWGLNEDETLGTFCGGIVWIPKPVLKLEFAETIDIFCGANSTYALTSSGDVYSWGKGRHGILGHGNEEDYQFPQKIKGVSSIVKLDTGGMHVVAWNENGDVFSWGYGRHGKLGTSSDDDVLSPTKIDIPEKKVVCEISCGYDRTLILLESQYITVSSNRSVKILSIDAEYSVKDVIKEFSDKNDFQIDTESILIDSTGNEICNTERIRRFTVASKQFFLIDKPTLWKEENDELQFIPSEDKQIIPSISSATIENLCNWLVHHPDTGEDYRKSFLIFHQFFISKFNLFQKIKEKYITPVIPKYLEGIPSNGYNIMRLQIINVLKEWINGNYYIDLSEESKKLLEEMKLFVDSIIIKEQPDEAKSLKLLISEKLTKINMPPRVSVVFTEEAPKPLPADHNRGMDIFKFPALEIARQLTIIEYFYYFKPIQLQEYLFPTNYQSDSTSSLFLSFRRFVHFSQWCVVTIIRGETKERRKNIIERFIDIAKYCLELNNYNTLFSILIALNNQYISHISLDTIDKSSSEILNQMMKLIVGEGLEQYREHYSKASYPKIPFLYDIIAQLSKELPDKNELKESNMIPYSKFNNAYTYIEDIINSNNNQYNLKIVPSFINYLKILSGYQTKHDEIVELFVTINQLNSETGDSIVNEIYPYLQNILNDIQNIIGNNLTITSEEDEIRSLSIRAKRISSGVNESERLIFWTSVIDKLLASSSRNSIANQNLKMRSGNANEACFTLLCRLLEQPEPLKYREILVTSKVIEYSILSSLNSYPTTPEAVQTFQSLLKSTFKSGIDIPNVDMVLKQLSTIQLSEKVKKELVNLFSCYKDIDIQARHNQISGSVRGLSRLQGLDNPIGKPNNFYNVLNELKNVQDFFSAANYYEDIVQCTCLQYQLLYQKFCSIKKVLDIYNGIDIDGILQFLDEYVILATKNVEESKNMKIQKESEMELELTHLEEQKRNKENELIELQTEEEELLKELQACEKAIETSKKNEEIYEFFDGVGRKISKLSRVSPIQESTILDSLKQLQDEFTVSQLKVIQETLNSLNTKNEQ